MEGIVDLNDLFNYEDQFIPEYIRNDHTPADNQITDEIATLGRVLFYDKKLSLNESISCASCHKQEFAFGDTSIVSQGFDGVPTERHSIRLVNISYGEMPDVFWDARTPSLEQQPTMTIANSIEMGFSGEQGQPRIDSLLRRLDQVDYYEQLFEFAYGDKTITEERVGKALAQFVRSIVSFDSKFDEGMAIRDAPFSDFENMTDLENYGRSMFFSPFPAIVSPFEPAPDSVNVFGCGNCHTAPNLSQSIAFVGNNGVTGVAGDTMARDFSAIRSPSLRNLFTPDGEEIGPFMHDGSLKDLDAVLEHYSFIPFDPENDNVSIGVSGLPFDARRPMSDHQVLALKAFMRTFTGTDVFTNPKWSDPFDEDGNISVIPTCNGNAVASDINVTICEGESFEGYTLAGNYEDTFTAANGCDSVRMLNLEVLTVVETRLDTFFCAGGTYNGLDVPGTYTEFYVASNGCDSIMTLNLEELETAEFIEEVTICEGEVYNGYTLAGTYTEVLTGINSCDSVYTLTLNVLELTHPDCEMVSTTVAELPNLSVFPNPATDKIFLEYPGNPESIINIYTMSGQLLLRAELSALESGLEVSQFPEGLLMVRLTDQRSGDTKQVMLIKS